MIRRQFGLPGTSILGTTLIPFDYVNPQASAITLADSATALSNTCRYRGLVPRGTFLSVAEHEVHTVRVAERLWPEIADEPHALWAFLHHDAAEYLGADLAGPAKVAFRELYGDAWDRFEARLAAVVFEAFDVDAGWLDLAHAKSADTYAYELERRWLFGWEDVELPPELESVVLSPGVTIGVSPFVAWTWYLAEVAGLAPKVGRQDLADEARALLGLPADAPLRSTRSWWRT